MNPMDIMNFAMQQFQMMCQQSGNNPLLTVYRQPAGRPMRSLQNMAGPVKLMQYVLDHAPKLACHYFEIATHLGDQCVWKLMLGFDEQTPGAKVNADNRRQNMVCVMNFVEVGHDCLELDESWFVPLVLRAGFSRAVRGVGILYRLTYVK